MSPMERALRTYPKLIPTAVTEMIRFVTPVVHQRRTATEDAEVGGNQIHMGDKVVMWYVSGNRDESVFVDADRLVLDREDPRPLSFGSGVHHCIGFRLAQMQVRCLWEELVERFSDIELLEPARRSRSNFVLGFLSLPVIARA